MVGKKRHLLYSLCMLLIVVLVTSACGGGNSKNALADNAKKTSSINYDTLSVQELEVEAKKEGKLIWYGAMVGDELDKIAKKFMEKYPDIKMEYIVVDSATLPSRVMNEQKGGKYNADVILATGWPIQQLKKVNALEKYISPEVKALDKGTADPEGYWAANFSLTYPIVYNPKKLKELGLQPPTSYEDLTKPEWKGHFSLHRADYEWYSSMLTALGEKGKKLTEDLAKNKPEVREGHPVVLAGVIAGEYPATVSAFGYKADQGKRKGEPVDYINPNPTVAVLAPSGIAKNAPHPFAARLFQTWLLSEGGQKFIFDSFGRTPTRKDVGKGSDVYDPSKYKYYYSDPSSGDNYENIAKEFNKVFGIGG